MHIRRLTPRFSQAAAGLVLVTTVLAAAGAARAQAPKFELKYGLSPRAEDAKSVGEARGLSIRPNVELPVYFFVKNLTAAPATCTVDVGGVTAAVTLTANETKAVSFAKPVPPPAPGAAAAPEPKPVWTVLPLARPEVRVQILDDKNQDKNQPLVDQKLEVSPAKISDYIATPKVSYSDGDLRVVVQALPGMAGRAPCSVQLVLDPARIPGLKTPLSKDADLQGWLSGPGDKVTLFAKGLSFDPGAAREATFSLTVDGYERAFLFKGLLANTESAVIAVENVKEYHVRPLVAGAENTREATPVPAGDKLPVRIEVDSVLDPDQKLFLFLGRRFRTEDFQKKLEIPLVGTKEHQTRFTTGPTGILFFQTLLNDWIVDVPIKGIVGEREVSLVDDNKDTANPLARASVVIDGTPPEAVAFLEPPARAVTGGDVRFTITATDNESGIDRVLFFFGKPPADGKLPPDTYEATEPTGGKIAGTWSARLPLPDHKGAVVVSAQVLNRAGLAAYAKPITVILYDPVAAAAEKGSGLGRIEGTVVEGDRPQAELPVALFDEKGKEVARTSTGKPDPKAKTDTTGKYAFEKVPPGVYRVGSAKKDSQTTGYMEVTVEADKTTKAKPVELTR